MADTWSKFFLKIRGSRRLDYLRVEIEKVQYHFPLFPYFKPNFACFKVDIFLKI